MPIGTSNVAPGLGGGVTCRRPSPSIAGEELAPDECKAVLNLPEGTKIAVDGSDYGTKRELSWAKLSRNKIYITKLQLAIPGGAKEDRTLLVEGGRRLALSAQRRMLLDPS